MSKSAFSAMLGNPPWVLYAGKGKQPIDPEEESFLKEVYGRAARLLSTHGVFAARAAALVENGGRVGLVMPTSVADASRYADARAAHDELCQVDGELPDFGDGAFAGVFQPSMGLVSTRRRSALRADDCAGPPWRLERPGMDPRDAALVDTLAARSKLPAELFGERGYRSSSADAGRFQKTDAPEGPFTLPLYEGSSVREFELLPPTAYADPTALPDLARPERWQQVAVFIRQTARFPIACSASGAAFRNSILAGFERGPWTVGALLTYLNSTPVRWLHFHQQRDAREGMPQVKIAHLRALPAPDAAAIPRLAAFGSRLAERNCGVTEHEHRELDSVVGAALCIPDEELLRVALWGQDNPVPARR